MPVKKITLSEVNKKRARILGFLISSAFLGWVLNTYILTSEALAYILGPAVNFVIYSILEELKGEGYREVLKK